MDGPRIPGTRVRLAVAKKRSRKWQYDFIEETIKKDASYEGDLLSANGERSCVIGGIALRLGWKPEWDSLRDEWGNDDTGYGIAESLPVLGWRRSGSLQDINDDYGSTSSRRKALLELVREWRKEEGLS